MSLPGNNSRDAGDGPAGTTRGSDLSPSEAAKKAFERETIDFETSSVDAAPDSYPTAIGRFQIERELGHGGLGIVLLAKDLELGRHVAIKIPRRTLLPDSPLQRRFLREGRAAARLNHPHLVPLYEVGCHGGLCYLVSELCVGPTLAEWLQSRKDLLPPHQAATLLRQLATAVHHAHSRGVLHRDIKPSNVLLTCPDSDCAAFDWQRAENIRIELSRGTISESIDVSELCAKLTDFGMAKLSDSDDETLAGTIIGTPAYMAPEQADGRIDEVDARTDVYALGAVLYELLTGVAPHRGTSEVDTLRHLLLNEPTEPRTLRRTVPPDLEAICLKCLARSPDARYPTAQLLAEDLGRFLQGDPTKVRTLGLGGWLRRLVHRRPTDAAVTLWPVASLAILSPAIARL